MRLLKMAARNLRRQSRRSLSLGAAVGFAVLVSVLVSSFSEGAARAVQDNLALSLGGHLAVEGRVRSASGRLQPRIRGAEALAKAVEAALPEALSAGRRVSANAVFVFGAVETRQRISGLEWEADRLYRSELSLLEGSFEKASEPGALLLDSDTYARLGAGLGDEVLLRFSTASGQHNVASYHVAAVYDLRSASPETGAIVPYEDLRQDLNLGAAECQAIAVQLPDLDAAPEAARRLREALAASWRLSEDPGAEGLEVLTVMDLMGDLATILGTIRWISGIVFVVMLSLTAAGILNTFRMILIERRREIGTMRCLGMMRGEVLALMLVEALGMGLGGGLAGAALGLGLGELLELLPLALDGSAALVLRQGRLLMEPNPLGIALSLGAVLATVVAASLPAAAQAARLEPAEALRSTA